MDKTHYWSDFMRLISLLSSSIILVGLIVIVGNSLYVLVNKNTTKLRRKIHRMLAVSGISGFFIIAIQFLRTVDHFNTYLSWRVIVIILADTALAICIVKFILVQNDFIEEVEKNMFRK